MKLSHLKIGSRLKLGFGISLMLVIFMSVFGVMSLNQMSDGAEKIIKESAHKYELAKNWQQMTEMNAVRTMALFRVNHPQDTEYFQQEIEKHSATISVTQKALEDAMTTDEEHRLIENVKEKRQAFLKARDHTKEIKAQNNDDATNTDIRDNFTPALQTYQSAINATIQYYKDEMDQAQNELKKSNYVGSSILIAAGAVSVILGFFVSWILTKSIVIPLQRAVTISENVAQGNLKMSQQTEFSKDELGQLERSLITMQNNLTQTLNDISRGADTVASASHQIAAGNMDLSSRTEEQAASLEETAATMEELTATVRQTATNAQEASELANQVSKNAQEGGQMVKNVVSHMAQIKEHSHKIDDIVALIDSIAFQTNILALNASVEAARAGEQGRGFAVVAGEVRNLSKRSAEAAKDIKKLIETSNQTIMQGHDMAGLAERKIQNIVNSIEHVADIVSHINAATQEQSSGISQVNMAVSQMDAVTQQNAALVEQASAASQALQEQGVALANLVHQFHIERS